MRRVSSASGKLEGNAFRDWIAVAPVTNQGGRPVAKIAQFEASACEAGVKARERRGCSAVRDTHSSKLFVMAYEAAEWISAPPSELIFLFKKVPGAFRIHLHPSLESDLIAGFGPAAEHG